jgi:hypothetical protein
MNQHARVRIVDHPRRPVPIRIGAGGKLSQEGLTLAIR